MILQRCRPPESSANHSASRTPLFISIQFVVFNLPRIMAKLLILNNNNNLNNASEWALVFLCERSAHTDTNLICSSATSNTTHEHFDCMHHLPCSTHISQCHYSALKHLIHRYLLPLYRTRFLLLLLLSSLVACHSCVLVANPLKVVTLALIFDWLPTHRYNRDDTHAHEHRYSARMGIAEMLIRKLHQICDLDNWCWFAVALTTHCQNETLYGLHCSVAFSGKCDLQKASSFTLNKTDVSCAEYLIRMVLHPDLHFYYLGRVSDCCCCMERCLPEFNQRRFGCMIDMEIFAIIFICCDIILFET